MKYFLLSVVTVAMLSLSFAGTAQTNTVGNSTPEISENPVVAIELVNPIGGTVKNKEGVTSIQTLLGMLILSALGLAGSLALLAFVYGSFLWLTSAGKSDKIQQGVRTMAYASLGLLVIFSAYGILRDIIGVLTN